MKLFRSLTLCAVVVGLAAPAAADPGAALKKLLPEPLSGWETMNRMSMKVGKGHSASAHYRKPGSPAVINVSFRTSVWDVKNKRETLTDPVRAKRMKMEIIEIDGRKWLLRVAKREDRILHTLGTVAGDISVNIQGFGDDRTAHEAYAKVINFDALSKVK